MHQLTLIDDEINKAYKLKELYRSFDNISKDEINDYDMEKELNSIIKQFRYSQIEEMKEVADTLNNWKKEILNSFVWVKNRRISNGPIEGKNSYIKKLYIMVMVYKILNVHEIEYYALKTNTKNMI